MEKPRKIKCPQDGKMKIEKIDDNLHVLVITHQKDAEVIAVVPRGREVWVKEGDMVAKGDQLTEGSVNLAELYKLKDQKAVQEYIIQEIQYVYSSQGQPLNNKHIEIIVKQMFSKIMIEFSGDTMLSPGEVVDQDDLIEENTKANAEGKQGAYGVPVLLGITKSSLSTQSFLSAASFQETTRVLIDAAVTGKIDYLRGLKENVIIGRLIPSGTGFKKEGEEEAKVESK